jgi:ubiquinone/menaquinone biosynthesis C-methylase UbiE
MTDNISSKNIYLSEQVEHWDRVANQSFSGANNYYRRYLERIYKYIIPPGSRVLEIGCGKGDLLAAVNPGEGIGVDQSGEMLRQAQEKFPHLKFVQSLGEEVQLEGTFDFIILSDLLNNVWDVQEFLAHIMQFCNDYTRLVSSGNQP